MQTILLIKQQLRRHKARQYFQRLKTPTKPTPIYVKVIVYIALVIFTGGLAFKGEIQ